MSLPFTFQHLGENVTKVDVVIPKDAASGWSQEFLLRADAHQDHPKCARRMETRHLDDALARGAGILDFGDLFCAMQGKDDPRASKEALRREDTRNDYLDSLIENAAKRYRPYAQNWLLLGEGNHTTSIVRKHGTSLIRRLASELNEETGADILAGGYTGWVRFQFRRGTFRTSRTLWYTHGDAGGGQATQGMPQFNNRRAYIDADIYCAGHIHRSWQSDTPRLKLNNAGKIERRDVLMLQLPTYKDGYGDGLGGFETEKGHGPRPLGAVMLKFWWCPERGLSMLANRIT